LQRYVSDVKSDINREMQLDELKKLQEEARKSAMEFETTVRSEVAGIEGGVSSSLQSASSAVAELENSMKSSVAPDVRAAELDRQLAEADTRAEPEPQPQPLPGIEELPAAGKAKS
jgi:sec-independent protein translocase protein TatB